MGSAKTPREISREIRFEIFKICCEIRREISSEILSSPYVQFL
jgi:hypothetical protein